MGLDPRDEARLCIIIEELIANLLEHGREPAERRISFAIARQDSSVQISIEDDGPPFDPRSAEFDAPIPDRGGGAGLRLVRAWAEVAGYRTAEGRNRLDLTMKLTDD